MFSYRSPKVPPGPGHFGPRCCFGEPRRGLPCSGAPTSIFLACLDQQRRGRATGCALAWGMVLVRRSPGSLTDLGRSGGEVGRPVRGPGRRSMRRGRIGTVRRAPSRLLLPPVFRLALRSRSALPGPTRRKPGVLHRRGVMMFRWAIDRCKLRDTSSCARADLRTTMTHGVSSGPGAAGCGGADRRVRRRAPLVRADLRLRPVRRSVAWCSLSAVPKSKPQARQGRPTAVVGWSTGRGSPRVVAATGCCEPLPGGRRLPGRVFIINMPSLTR